MSSRLGRKSERMDNLGFVRDELDIKILILFILARLPGPVDPVMLTDLTLFDGGFTWFDYQQCLEQLIDTGHIEEKDGRLRITEKGRRNVNTVQSSLPYSVRAKAEHLTAPIAATMRRNSMIETSIDKGKKGNLFVSLRLSDAVDEIYALRLAAPDEATAKKMEKTFRERAEELYNQIASLLLPEDGSGKKA